MCETHNQSQSVLSIDAGPGVNGGFVRINPQTDVYKRWDVAGVIYK